MSFSGITPKILTFEYYAKNKISLLECPETIEKNMVNRLIKYPLLIQDGPQNSKMAATKFSYFFDISTLDCGDFLRIIEIALFIYNI